MDIQIAPTTQAQLTAVLHQTRATFEEHRARHPKAFPERLFSKIERRHRKAIEARSTDATSFAATADGAPCGFVLLRPVATVGMIYDIGVFPEFRQNRVGLSLVTHALSVARDRRWEMLLAAVWDGNDASHALFKSAGFVGTPAGFLARLFPRGRTTGYSYRLSGMAS